MNIPLSGGRGRGHFAVIDDDDAEKVVGKKWYLTDTGYARASRRIGNKNVNIRMHHLIVKQKAGLVTDHINHDKLDNRKANLRLVTPIENNHNRKRGLRYYYFDKSKNLWKVVVMGFYVGGFRTEALAIEARDKYLHSQQLLLGVNPNVRKRATRGCGSSHLG